MNREQALGLRSLLFVPALSEGFVEKAHTRGADAVIVDLEDSIAPDAKARARAAVPDVVARIAAHGLPVFVRVNNEPAHLAADRRAALPDGEEPLDHVAAGGGDVARRHDRPSPESGRLPGR